MIDMLEGKVALVTGASKGIGKAIADTLQLYGASVMRTFNTNHKVEGNYVWLDLASNYSIKHAIEETINTFGGLDILVNNAAIIKREDFLNTDLLDMEKVVMTNLVHTMYLTQQVVNHMLQHTGGNIINIASIAGHTGGYKAVPYAASKAALINFTKSLSNLYARNGIRANCVAPGLILNTGMTQTDHVPVESIPMRRYGLPEDVAGVVAFLASDMASYISGETINVNGGTY